MPERGGCRRQSKCMSIPCRALFDYLAMLCPRFAALPPPCTVLHHTLRPCLHHRSPHIPPLVHSRVPIQNLHVHCDFCFFAHNFCSLGLFSSHFKAPFAFPLVVTFSFFYIIIILYHHSFTYSSHSLGCTQHKHGRLIVCFSDQPGIKSRLRSPSIRPTPPRPSCFALWTLLSRDVVAVNAIYYVPLLSAPSLCVSMSWQAPLDRLGRDEDHEVSGFWLASNVLLIFGAL